jgi:stage V sporulation protein R
MTTEKRRVAADLAEPVREARALARKLGLDPYDVEYWVVDHDEMNELIAYEGFQKRYPHWRWGENYERQKAKDRYLGGKAFEIVNNDDPAAAFLQESNRRADQKAVITHVEAHADFFANNEWFAEDPDAAGTLARHARRVERYANDPDVDRSEVERWIDNARSIADVIDVHNPDAARDGDAGDGADPFAALDVSEEVREAVLDGWEKEGEGASSFPAEPERDLLRFLVEHGRAYDAETERAVDYEPWQRGVLSMLREEAHYFAPQRLTKVMNEGWAAYWESVMMGEEAFADDSEAITYADHQAQVLNSPGLNPYKLGKELWEYVENDANRRAVLERLLRVEGVTWRNFGDAVDFDAVRSALAPDPEIDAITPETLDRLDSEDPRIDAEALDAARAGEIDIGKYPWKVLTTAGLAERHFSLAKPQHRGFLERAGRSELERVSRYLLETERYASVEAALADLDYGTGWERMCAVRESHNDVTFLDEFLTGEFVAEHGYFAYEYSRAKGDYRATGADAESVKKKLLLQFTNFGKPRITVRDGNYNNRNELLLAHEYNGVVLDLERAKRTLERVFELWGRPVALKTVVKRVSETARDAARRRGVEPDPEERGLLVRYDGEGFSEEELPADAVADIAASDLDYDTRPEEWL